MYISVDDQIRKRENICTTNKLIAIFNQGFAMRWWFKTWHLLNHLPASLLLPFLLFIKIRWSPNLGGWRPSDQVAEGGQQVGQVRWGRRCRGRAQQGWRGLWQKKITLGGHLSCDEFFFLINDLSSRDIIKMEISRLEGYLGWNQKH